MRGNVIKMRLCEIYRQYNLQYMTKIRLNCALLNLETFLTSLFSLFIFLNTKVRLPFTHIKQRLHIVF